MTTLHVVKELKTMFARFGIPDVLISDSGPQFASQDFADFATRLGFCHVTSSPHYLQANKEVERAVQTAKSILRQEDADLALMIYRATPVASTGYSPAQLLMGRQIRTTLPVLTRNLQPRWPIHNVVQMNDDHSKSLQKYYYDRRNGVQALPPLQSGQQVLVKTDRDKNGLAPLLSKAQTPEGPHARRP